MKADLSRNTFDPARHFSAVRLQQGRIVTDADWNEQADVTRHRDERQAVDVIGGCGGPVDGAGFALVAETNALAVAALDASQAWVAGEDGVAAAQHRRRRQLDAGRRGHRGTPARRRRHRQRGLGSGRRRHGPAQRRRRRDLVRPRRRHRTAVVRRGGGRRRPGMGGRRRRCPAELQRRRRHRHADADRRRAAIRRRRRPHRPWRGRWPRRRDRPARGQSGRLVDRRERHQRPSARGRAHARRAPCRRRRRRHGAVQRRRRDLDRRRHADRRHAARHRLPRRAISAGLPATPARCWPAATAARTGRARRRHDGGAARPGRGRRRPGLGRGRQLDAGARRRRLARGRAGRPAGDEPVDRTGPLLGARHAMRARGGMLVCPPGRRRRQPAG